jgi:hypothetical protein
MSSAAVTSSPASNLLELALKWFGKRGAPIAGSSKQAPTVGIGYMSNVNLFFVAKQGGPCPAVPGKYCDAGNSASTSRKMSEWTGYHSEMLIISAMLAYLKTDARSVTIDQARILLKEHGGTIVIAANADCCKHCSNVLESLGCSFAVKSSTASLTGWWNPFNDKVYAQADAEFSKDIPGHTPSSASVSSSASSSTTQSAASDKKSH